MKTIVFGGSGFLGSHVADELSKKGHDVTIFDVKQSPYLKNDQKMIIGNVLDCPTLNNILQNMDIVYNFTRVPNLDADPLQTLKNIEINANILNCLKDKKISRYLYASTLYVFSDSGLFYKDSKVACEMYVESFHKKYGIPYTILRYGSIYGERTNYQDRISLFVKEALDTGKITYHGDGEEIREYINVKDAARCSVEILDKDFINENITITGSQSIKIKDLMKMIGEILKVKIKLLENPNDFHYGITPYKYKKRDNFKYIPNHYIDLGMGIIESAKEVEKNGY